MFMLSLKKMTRPVPHLVRATLAMFMLALAAISPASAGFQIITDFTQEITSTDRKEGITRGISNGSIRSLGFSWRPRWSKTLLERNGRQIELLIGPYFRIPTLISLTGFGTSISSLFMWELGADVGISWFGYAKTSFVGIPLSKLSYSGTATGVTGAVAYNISGSGFGFRLDVPIFRLESDPGDQRVEIGATASYHIFTISSVESQEPNKAVQETSDTQDAGSRLSFGAFLNVRL